MARPTYRSRVLVLKKTNLGETDLILTMLEEDGSQLRAVAKGARKPKSSFAARLDLFCVCDVLAAPGRSLDVISEARLVEAHMPLKTDIARVAAAAPVLESLTRTTQEGLPVPRLFDMAAAVLAAQAALGASAGESGAAAAASAAPPSVSSALTAARDAAVPALTAAFLVKLFAILGFRPLFDACVSCGAPVAPAAPGAPVAAEGGTCDFSFTGGGVVCSDCSPGTDSVRMPAATLKWAKRFLSSTFEQVILAQPPLDASFAVLEFCQSWLGAQLGLNLKSLAYLLSSGLY